MSGDSLIKKPDQVGLIRLCGALGPLGLFVFCVGLLLWGVARDNYSSFSSASYAFNSLSCTSAGTCWYSANSIVKVALPEVSELSEVEYL